MAPSGPHLPYCPLLNNQYREKQVTVCSFQHHRSKREKTLEQGQSVWSSVLFFIRWNYEVLIAVGPLSAEGFTKERQNFPQMPIPLFEIGGKHSNREGKCLGDGPQRAKSHHFSWSSSHVCKLQELSRPPGAPRTQQQIL